MLFLVSHTELSSWRYKRGARPQQRFHSSRTQMSALAVRLGSWSNSNKTKCANVYFAWLDKPLWTIAPVTWLLSVAVFPCSFEILLSLGDGFCCCPFDPESWSCTFLGAVLPCTGDGGSFLFLFLLITKSRKRETSIDAKRLWVLGSFSFCIFLNRCFG